MKTKLTFLSLVLCLALAGAHSNAGYIQQTPKKGNTKSSVKPAKKPTPKKSVKKPKAGNVFICDGQGGYTYHSRSTCKDLSKCKGRVLDVSLVDAKGSYGRKKCKLCY